MTERISERSCNGSGSMLIDAVRSLHFIFLASLLMSKIDEATLV
jgi:hypothetical protein